MMHTLNSCQPSYFGCEWREHTTLPQCCLVIVEKNFKSPHCFVVSFKFTLNRKALYKVYTFVYYPPTHKIFYSDKKIEIISECVLPQEVKEMFYTIIDPELLCFQLTSSKIFLCICCRINNIIIILQQNWCSFYVW